MEVNETGHVQELERNFSLFSICAVGIVTGNTWAALGGSIVIAIYNGGPPGVLYEFIAVSIFYWLIAASLAVSVFSIIGKYPLLTSSYRNLPLRCHPVPESITGLPSHQVLSMVA